MENILVETVGGSKPIKAITGKHKVLGTDGRFHKVKIIKSLKEKA
jgi:hypothetical protein